LENSSTDVIYNVDILFIAYDAFLDQPASDTLKNEKPNNLKIFGINEAK
jgi:hypothetical protein